MPDILINVWTKLHGRSVDDTEKDLQKRLSKAGTDAGNNFSQNFERSLNASNPKIRRAAERLADATAVVAQNNRLRALSEQRVAETSRVAADVEERLTRLRRDGQGISDSLAREENRLTAARRESSAAERQFVRDTTSFERAVAKRKSAIKDFEESYRSLERTSRGGGRGGGQAGNTLGGIFTSIPFVPGGKAGAVIGTGLVTGLGAVVEAVTTASQALWLLPAAATAAGAGFLTLKIGLSGFDKALKDMSDPKKWAEDLQKLSPAAQQAALEIQHLVGGLDSLKNLVQESLFKGVAQQLHNLGNAFMPSIRQMLTGVSGAFNEMFSGAVGQLTSAGTSAGIGNIVNNIVKAFQNLAPAMAPVVDAFVKITQVGSTFLPGLGSSITDLANRFDEFITHAQQTGQLRHWIQQGLDAAKSLGHFLGELAHKFYDVFGNKSPQQFAQTLKSITGILTGIGRGMVILANAVNGLVQDLNPVARAVGGWPNLIRDVVAAWALWKVEKTLGLLGTVGNMLRAGLPAAAAEGAGGVSAALAAIKVPGWLSFLMSAPALAVGATGVINATTSTDNLDAILKGLPFGVGPLASGGYDLWKKAHGKGLGDDKVVPGHAVPKPGELPGDAKWPSGAWGNKPWSDPGNQWWKDPWSPYDVPGVPGKKGRGGVGADKEATPYGPGYDAPPRPGETEEVYSAEGAVMDAKHRTEQDRATLLKMQQDNNVTAEELQAQENKIVHDQRESYEAQMRLTDAQQNAYKKQLKGLKDADDEFNNIDQDFGLSKGLPGLVKNLVGMIGDIAAAPMMGQLKAIAAATGTDKNTFGALGMMGQKNIAEGKSPLFGIAAGQPGGPAQLTPEQQYAIYGNGSASGGPGATAQTMPSYSAMPGAGPASIAPGAAVAGYSSGGTGAQLTSAIRPAGGPGAQGPGGLNWDALAAKESSGNWGTNTGNGYFGGLQFDQSTWNAYKPPGAPSNPAQATKEQQIAAGQAGIAARGGPQSLWPQNYGQLYHSPHRPWSAQYDSYQPMGSWLGSVAGPGTSGIASAGLGGDSGGVGDFGVPPGLDTYNGAHTSDTHGLLTPRAAALKSLISRMFGVTDIGGYRQPDGFNEHSSGEALDIMVGKNKALGDEINQYLLQNAKSLGLQYDIWQQQQWNPGQNPIGMADRGSPTQNHMDHVHARVLPGALATQAGFGQSPVQRDFRLADFSQPLGVGDVGGTPPGFGGDGLPGAIGNAGSAPFIVQNPSGKQGMGINDWMNQFPSADGGVGGPSKPAPRGGPGQPDPTAPAGEDPTAPPTPIGAPRGGGWQPQGGGGNGIGGLPLAAAMTAASMFPGGGAAAQTAMQLINRTIGYGQQAAAIGVQGLMDTFKISSPDGDDGGKSDLSQGWFGRVAAGFAGARPAIPSGAGKAPTAKKDSDPSKDPSGKDALGQGGDTNHTMYGNGVFAPGGTVNIGGQPQPGMAQTDANLSAAAAPVSPSFGGFSL